MVFTGTDPKYTIEKYLNAFTANLISSKIFEPVNTPLHQDWIHRRTPLIQTTLDGAAQKWLSVLSVDIKSDWKIFTLEFSKKFDSERNKQHQRILCMGMRGLPNETIKQLAVRFKNLVRKAYSLKKHKNERTLDGISYTTSTKNSDKKESIASIFKSRPDRDFRKLVDKLQPAEISIKL